MKFLRFPKSKYIFSDVSEIIWSCGKLQKIVGKNYPSDDMGGIA